MLQSSTVSNERADLLAARACRCGACASCSVFNRGGGNKELYLAGVTLDDNVSTLAEGRALHGVGEGRSGGDRLEGLLVLLIVLGLCGSGSVSCDLGNILHGSARATCELVGV